VGRLGFLSGLGDRPVVRLSQLSQASHAYAGDMLRFVRAGSAYALARVGGKEGS
jgi:hypothetical protein